MLTPTKDWYWQYDEQQKRLTLDLGEDMLFVTPYATKQLSGGVLVSQGFSLENMEFYTRLQQELEASGLKLSPAMKTQIAINATAVKSFYRPLMPKSWYFQRQENFGDFHQLSVLNSECGSALVLVIEREGQSALCMLLSQQLTLCEDKELNQFDVIKVMQDCLCPYLPEISQPLAKSA